MATSGRPTEVLNPSAEKTNYIRLSRLLMCGGTKIVREVFDSIIPPSQLPAKLKEQDVVSRLNEMRRRRILTLPQWKVLFPSPGTYGKSKSFDLTLLFKLLRAFCGLAAPPRGWDVLPDDNDYSLPADLARIRYYRNGLSHATEDLGISDGEFETYWNRIKDALLRMAQTLSPSLGPPEDWEKEIDKLLTGPVTDDDERNIEELKSWYIQDMDTKETLNQIMKQLGSMQLHRESQSDFDAEPHQATPQGNGTESREIVPYAPQNIELLLPEGSDEAKVHFSKLVEELALYRTSRKDPPADMVMVCRKICQQCIKEEQRKKLIEELRKCVPSGTTGPLEKENKLYSDLDAKKRQDLTRALCGPDTLRRIVCEFGKSNDWVFYDRMENPAEFVLEEESTKQNLTVGELYDVLVKCDANALADKHL